MSNDSPPPGPSEPPHQPNWGSAYPPPPGAPQPGSYPPPGYPQQPGGYQQPSYYAYGPPKHPSATTAMVLGIIAIAGGFLCYLPIFAAPFAWFVGAKAVREIDASKGALSGRGEASAGKILGIIGTVLLVLALLAIIALVVLTFTVDDFWGDTWDDEY